MHNVTLVTPFQESAQDVVLRVHTDPADDVHLPERGPKGPADDVPFRDRGPRGLAGPDLPLELLHLQIPLLCRPIMDPFNRLCYSIIALMYSHFVFKIIYDSEFVSAHCEAFTFILNLILPILYIQIIVRFRIR